MTLVQAIVLGLTQGLSEFLPISSSGHLILVPWAFGWMELLEDADVKKTFDVALHAGTLVAVCVYFRRDLVRLARALGRNVRRRRVGDADERLVWIVAVATIPAAVIGALFESFFNGAGQPWVIGLALAAFGVVMLVIDRRAGRRGIDDLRLRDGLLVGIAQAAALVPGVSRSGVTISAGILAGQSRETAARFSFLLSIPVIFGAGVYKGLDLVRDGFPANIGPSAFAVGIVASGVSGFAAVAGLVRFLQRRSLGVFVAYRAAVAAAVLVIIMSGLRGPTL